MAKHCETCTCGLIKVCWADREAWVDPTNNEELANVIINCTLDHFYDRTITGIPSGFPLKHYGELADIVIKHMMKIDENWINKTVDMTDEQELSFRKDLLDCLNRRDVK
jgi:hypothetical protein